MNRSWRLPDLLEKSGIRLEIPIPEILVSQVTDDSRSVKEGALFVAVKGSKADGHRFIPHAVARGARLVLVEEDVSVPAPAIRLKVKSTREILGPLVSAFLGQPSKRIKTIGVTGTNGKTTTVWLIQHLLENSGVPCGLIGTVWTKVGNEQLPSENTTPGAVFLNQTLSRMGEKGLKACAMEVSSHALDQYRTEGIEFSCGVFTNISPEHLDYHRSFGEYLKAKLRLFQNLSPHATCVVNRDDPCSKEVLRSTKARILTFGLKHEADLTAEDLRLTLEATTLRLKTPQGTFPVDLPLIGRHNVENLLAALGAGMALEIPLEKSVESLRCFPGVPGRLQRIEEGQPFPVFVDYAHTDRALFEVLSQLRSITSRKILVVFGCGGDRDRTKRPRMGRIAAQLADRVIITSDNPRSEDPAQIAQEISLGFQGSSTPWQIVLDRRQAIQSALESKDSQGLVLIAGKGHETVQILQDKTIPFDDRAVAREILLSHGLLSTR